MVAHRFSNGIEIAAIHGRYPSDNLTPYLSIGIHHGS